MKISNGDPVIKMKALNILKVHNYLFRAHKKVSLLTVVILKNYCRGLKKIDQLTYKEIKELETSIKKKFVPLLEWCQALNIPILVIKLFIFKKK